MGVGTYNHNTSGDKNCQNRDALYHALMAVLLMSNGVTVGGACMLLAIVMAVRENYDYAIINGLIGTLNLYLGGANIQCAKTCRGNIQKLIKSKQVLEKPRW